MKVVRVLDFLFEIKEQFAHNVQILLRLNHLKEINIKIINDTHFLFVKLEQKVNNCFILDDVRGVLGFQLFLQILIALDELIQIICQIKYFGSH